MSSGKNGVAQAAAGGRRVVLTYGTFDLFHIGHLSILKRLKALGDELVVGVSTDEFNAVKGKKTVVRFEDRLEIVRNVRCVDRVIPESSWEQKLADVRRFGVSTFGMGDDWKGRFDFLREHCEVVYLSRTAGVSSTDMKRLINVLDQSHVSELKVAFEMIGSVVNRFT